MKKIKSVAIVLVFCLLIGCAATCFAGAATATFPESDTWDGTCDTSWYNTKDTVFTLTTAEQLAGLAAIVNGTVEGENAPRDSFKGKTINLAANIVLNEGTFTYAPSSVDSENKAVPGTVFYNGEEIVYNSESKLWETKTSKNIVNAWTPIGNLSGNNNIENVMLVAGVMAKPGVFLGNFNGMGHTVSGMFISTVAEENTDCYKGFFGTFAGASLKNLTITNSYVYGAGRLGLIAGMAYGLVAKDTAEDEWEKYVEAGKCAIYENLHTEGFVAAYHTSVGNRMSGGLFGILRLYDKGDEASENNVKTNGGIQYVTRCSFKGIVDLRCDGQSAGGLAGWIAGFGMTSASNGKYDVIFDNCYAEAKLIAKSMAGGIAAYGYRADFVFQNCVTACTAATATSDRVGALLGISYYNNAAGSDHYASLILKKCYFFGDPSNDKFDIALGVQANNNFPIDKTDRSDLTGAAKVAAGSEITGLDSNLWTINGNTVTLSRAYVANEKDPVSDPIVPAGSGEVDPPVVTEDPNVTEEQPNVTEEQPTVTGEQPNVTGDNTQTDGKTPTKAPDTTAEAPTSAPGSTETAGNNTQNEAGCSSSTAFFAVSVLSVVAVMGMCIVRKPRENG